MRGTPASMVIACLEQALSHVPKKLMVKNVNILIIYIINKIFKKMYYNKKIITYIIYIIFDINNQPREKK